MSDTKHTYDLRSVKSAGGYHATGIVGYREAIRRAKQIAAEYQPAYGVDVCRRPDGATVRTVGD